ncbi:MAG TPA: hypothetical protein VFN97_15045 [Actinospica sp.]|nr:hypothetical protein [Actinospica sp.]
MSADTERAYAAADTWRAMAEAAHDAWAEARGVATALTANNSGPTVDAFETRWRSLGDASSRDSLPRLVARCAELAQACEQYAVRLGTSVY